MAASSCTLPSSLAEDDVAAFIEEVRQVSKRYSTSAVSVITTGFFV
jgi:hypothetical protein